MYLVDIVTCSIIGAYVLLAVILRLKSNLPLIAAPLLLVVTGIVLASGQQDLADQLGFSVFYLLVGGAVLLVADRVRQRPRKE